jgi:hypothetical protein
VSQGSGSMLKLSGADAEAMLAQPPAERGFWTDEELLQSTRLGSVPLLKKVQATGWLHPDYLPLPGGGRRRVWKSTEVLRASVLAELADRASISVLAAAKLLARIGTEWVDQAARLRERLKTDQAAPQELPTRLCLVDDREAWTEQPNGDFRLVSSGMSLRGAQPEVPRVQGGRPTFTSPRKLTESGAVITYVHMGRFQVSAITSVLNLEPQFMRVPHSR